MEITVGRDRATVLTIKGEIFLLTQAETERLHRLLGTVLDMDSADDRREQADVEDGK